ncbi:MAG: retropepsin-like domain-containing protein [Proteobacteria bacterium]|nr:retropepsin-like domain-containing protein [Pseudomonadota bacterium]
MLSGGFVLSAHADEACTITRLASVQMEMDPTGRPFVPMQIDGSTVDMLIDTGGVISALTEDSVASLGLHKTPIAHQMYFEMFGGAKLKSFVRAPNVALGGMKADEMLLVVMPNRAPEIKLGGTLAPDIIGAYDAEFDFAGSRFNLYSQHHCPGNVVYWATDYAVLPFTFEGKAHIDVKLLTDGVDFTASLDTGSATSFMSLELAERLFDFDLSSPNLEIVRNEPDTHIYRYRFKSMAFGGVAVNNPDILLVPDSESKMPRTAIIGANVLRKLHLYVAYREHKLYITAADAH